MKQLHIGASSLNQTPLHWNNNFNNILTAIEEAKSNSVELLLLPELAVTGYGCEDVFLSPGTTEKAYEQLVKIADYCSNITVAIGTPFLYRNSLYNGVAIISDGNILGIAAKQNLANGDVHYESRWFKPWPPSVSSSIKINGKTVPVGDIIFHRDGVRIGFEICEDAWVASRPGRALAYTGIDIILNPSASHFAFQKNDVRRRFILEGSRAFGVTYVYTNLLGNESGRIIYDGASLIASNGKMVNESTRFSYHSTTLTSAVIDIDKTQAIQLQQQNSSPVNELSIKEIHIPGSFAFTTEPLTQPQTVEELTKEEEFSRAVPLALFDYMRKSYSKGYVISLSGGADSSAVSTLVWLMLNQARKELGENFAEKLSYIGELSNSSLEEVCSRLITCVYQGTKNSSDTTLNASRELAEAINAEFHVWNIDSLVETYTSAVESSLGRSTTWETDDLALQNIQARVRAPGVWMLANIKGALLASTSNRSEAAVGYATMDGDTSGGISPLAGIDKQFLRHWLCWIEETGTLPALHAVNVQQPTAELRPSETGQTDEEDLMPYPVLNRIELLSIRDRKYPQEILTILLQEYNEVNEQTVASWVVRFFRLWSRNQWKRERYAPSFHLDETNLDPRSFCRFPILSGGYSEELQEICTNYNI